MLKTADFKKTKIWTTVDATTLQEDIIPFYKPAIIKGAQKKWDIAKLASQTPSEATQYLNKISRGLETIELFVGEKSINGRYGYNDHNTGFNFQKGKTQLTKALSFMRECLANKAKQTAYAGAIEIDKIIPDFHTKNLMQLLRDQKDTNTNLWIGNPSQVSIHFDQQDNLASVVRGKRKFLLFPPEQINNLYVGPLDNTIAGPPSSLVNMENPDFQQHPKFKEALKHAEVAELAPGDTLYIPSLWWHGVEASGDICILVNYWWNNAKFKEDTITPMLFSMMAISHLPLKEREAWKQFFEYYVFRTESSPASHLTQKEQGILGETTPSTYKQMQSYIFNKIQKLIANQIRR